MPDGTTLEERTRGKVSLPRNWHAGKPTLIGKTVRAPFPHGRIHAIEPPSSLPKGVYLVTQKDLHGGTDFPLLAATMPLLAKDNFFYQGEPIALVAGPTGECVSDFIATLRIHCEPLPLREETTVFERKVEKGDIQEAFKKAKQRVQQRFATPAGNALTPPLPTISCQKEGKELVLHGITQWPAHLLRSVSKAIGIEKERIRLHLYDPGRTMDAKIWLPSYLACHAAILCWQSKQPVTISYSLEEALLYTPNRVPTRVDYDVGLDETGAIVAMDVAVVADMGAYPFLSQEILDRICLGAAGIYECDNLRVHGRVVLSHSPPRGPWEGWGLAQGFYASERLATEVAQMLRQSPVRWRATHRHQRGTPLAGERGGRSRTHALDVLLKRITIASDFDRKYAAYRLERQLFDNIERKSDAPWDRHRGIGIACCYHSGYFLSDARGDLRGLGRHSVTVELKKSEKLTVELGVVPENDGELLRCRKQAAHILELKLEGVEIVVRSGEVGPETLSQSAYIIPRLLDQCCQKIKKRRFRDPLPIREGRCHARLKGRSWDTTLFRGNPFPLATWAVFVVEVEVDWEGREISVKHVWVALEGECSPQDVLGSEFETSFLYALDWVREEGKSTHTARIPSMPLPPYTLYPHRPSQKRTFPGNIRYLPLCGFPSAYAQAVNQALGRDGDLSLFSLSSRSDKEKER